MRIRKLNDVEKKQLYQIHYKRYGKDKELAQDLVDNYWYVVIEDYISDCPGYAGKIIIAIYGDACFYEIFVERDGKLEHEDTEMNEWREPNKTSD